MLAFCSGILFAGTLVGKQCKYSSFRCTARRIAMATNTSVGADREEHFDVVHEDGTPTGLSKTRSLVHRDGDWHRSTHIWVLSSEGDVLVQKRAVGKDTFPVC